MIKKIGDKPYMPKKGRDVRRPLIGLYWIGYPARYPVSFAGYLDKLLNKWCELQKGILFSHNLSIHNTHIIRVKKRPEKGFKTNNFYIEKIYLPLDGVKYCLIT